MLDYHTNHEVLDYLDSDTLRTVSTLNKMYNTKYRDLIYYRHALEKKLLYSLSYFLEDEFTLPFLNNSIQTLLDYVNERSDLLIAGGFPTQLYMGKIPKESSDIDIYVLANELIKNGEVLSASLIEQVKELINFLEISYTVIGMVRVGPSVYTIYVKEIEHPIQIIVTTNGTPAEILSSFDNSHNRCGIYKGHTYIGRDTKLSHQKMVTYFYSTPKASRYQKAIDLGFKIFGISDTELVRILSEPVNQNMHILKKLQTNTIITSLLEVKAHKNWKISYAAQELVKTCYDIEIVDLEKELPIEIKKSLSNATMVHYYGKNNKLKMIMELKSPNSYYLKIRKPHLIDFQFTIKAAYTYTPMYLLVTNPDDIQKMKKIKETIISIFINYHGSIPEHIKRCRCNTDWNTFKEYRKEIGHPITVSTDVSSIWGNGGYEYYDGIVTFDDKVYIKTVEFNLLASRVKHIEKTFTLSCIPIIRNNETNSGNWGLCEYRIKSIE
jgi:hypothetical protein